MAVVSTTKRRRLCPEERRREILDAACRLVLKDGISTLTMDKIACEAVASKALLYSYFPNLSGLLQEVYNRELRKLQSQHLEALNTPHGFEDMVKLTAKINRENQNERQVLIKRLEADSKVKSAMTKADRRVRSDVVNFLSGEITDNYDIPKDIAAKAIRLALQYDEKEPLHDAKKDLQQDEIWGAMMVGAKQELEKRFGKKRKRA